MQLNPYLFFNGNCEAAFQYYAQCLGGKVADLVKYAGSPGEETIPAEWRDKIMHVRLAGDGFDLMGSDAPPPRYRKPDGFRVAIQTADVAEAERIFKALADQGTVEMPFQKTFFSRGFGMLADRFGISWMINCT